MFRLYCVIALCLSSCSLSHAQKIIKGFVIDILTNEPLSGVNINLPGEQTSTLTDDNGKFILHPKHNPDSILVSSVGYRSRAFPVTAQTAYIALTASFANLSEVVVSANREVQPRSEAPVAIQVISKTTINDTKATRLDMLINKIPGVFMVDLGNEQHSMSIRQPLGTGSLFLYLQDGIPIRTIGDFNHNALIEINQAAIGKIEVIKGPASSLYGSEAVGGAVNFITQAPSQLPAAKVQAEIGGFGYKRSDFFVSGTRKKLGLYLGGYYAEQDQSENQHNDFRKGALTFRADYSFNNSTKLVITADYIHYKTDQKGGLDSNHFYNKDYISSYRFTYRKVDALRIKSTLNHVWNDNNKTSATLFYRKTAIGQNPFYSIANIAGNPLKAKGQINEDAFKSYGAFIQHNKKFNLLNARLIAGISTDFSPATYYAGFINVDKNNNGIYYGYTSTDSLLTDYNVNLLNTALYTQFEINPTKTLKLVAAARYDRMDFSFDNHLPPGAFTGAPDASNGFDHFTPKLGLTYNFDTNRGLYANYSVGFAPPNITDLYRGVKVPVLKPSSYTNYELGGWLTVAQNKGYLELSLYQLDGTNEIVSTRLADGTYQNQNAGQTRHKGIEASIKYSPVEDIMVRIGGTYAQHRYTSYILEGKNYSGNEMSQSPGHIINSEITYKPHFLQGLRVAVEWQTLGSYFTDAANTAKYKGFNVFNARSGFTVRGLEIWLNWMNVTNAIYAVTVEKSSFGTTYRPGQLSTVNVGVGYYFNKKD